MKTYDVILVLGRGVSEDGEIPESAKATVKKAIELYKEDVAPKIIFSGKWSYQVEFTPQKTEARAMADYAKSLGLPEDAILLEQNSDTSMTNIYYIKESYLIPNNWKKVILISVEPFHTRAFLTLEKMLGHDYICKLVLAGFKFPKEKYESSLKLENEKLSRRDHIYGSFKDGDHQAYFDEDRRYLRSQGFKV